MPLPPRTNIKVLNPEIERLLYQVKVIEEEAAGLMSGLSPAQFNWRPKPGSWSMGECIDHLNITAKSAVDAFEAAISKARAAGKLSDGPYAYGFLGRWFLRITLPPVKTRFPALAALRPTPGKKYDTVMSEWNKGHERLKQVIESANGVDLRAVKVASPANKLVKLNLGVMMWIATAHEKRHLWQVRNLRNNPGFPPA